MSRHLLDVNVLLALVDVNHLFHAPASEWFTRTGRHDWVTCPIVENGAIRVSTHPSYASSRTPHEAIESLHTLMSTGSHQRIPDDVSLVSERIDPHRITGSAQITDLYLALLAQKHDATLATFDRHISTAAINGTVKIFRIPA